MWRLYRFSNILYQNLYDLFKKKKLVKLNIRACYKNVTTNKFPHLCDEKNERMKLLLILLFSFPFYILAQNKPLVIEGVSPNLYVNHTVAPKENYYSIGRIYNISPKEIAPFNNLVLESGLSLGQTLKIPLSAANFLQTGEAGADEVLVPVYHPVADKEGLYRISTNYNKLPLETLKKWNNLKTDAVSNGTNLIVGYLKVKKGLSPLANMAKTKPADNISPAVENKKPVAVVKENVKPEIIKEVTPVNNIVKEKPPVEVVKKEPVVEAVDKETSLKKEAIPVSGKNFNGGVFKADYEKQVNNKNVLGENGEAGIFKSTSGWGDGRYYCLHSTSTPGTILKITSNTTGKSIYAKVLDVIPDINQNNGLLLLVSNAAARELGISDLKFSCSVTFSK